MTKFRHLIWTLFAAAGLVISASPGFAQKPDVGDQPGLLADDSVELEIAPGVITTWMKLAVRDRIEPADEDDDDDEYEDDDAEDDDDVYIDGVNASSDTSSAIEAPSDPDKKK